MKKIIITCGLVLVGLIAGIAAGMHALQASSPEGESSGGESPASVSYDEKWKATEALVSSSSGYKLFYPYGKSPVPPYVSYPLSGDPVNKTTPVAASFSTSTETGTAKAEILPKMVVTKWKVHGHIHFE